MLFSTPNFSLPKARLAVSVLILSALVADSSLVIAESAGNRSTVDPTVEISAYTSGIGQALEAGKVFLAEHKARRGLSVAYTVLGKLEIADSQPQAAEEALAEAAARAPAFALDARALLHGLRASRGGLDPALGELRLLTQMAPDHREARRQLVLALVHAGTLDEAALELAALRRQDTDAAQALSSLVESKDAPPAWFYAGPLAELPAAEREALRSSLRAVIDGTEAQLAKALTLGAQHEESSADGPPADGSPAAAFALAREALTKGEVKRALDHARRALDAAPSSEGLLRFYATVALDADLTSVAAPSVETLARMDPESGEYAFMVGRVWLQLGKTGEASEALLRAVELAPDLLPARRELALALGAESRYEPSKEHLELFLSALEDPWQDLEAQAALAEAEVRLGDVTTAEERALRVLEKDPDHARGRLVHGLVLVGRGEFELARAELEKSIAMDPKLAQAHYRLSFACARLGDRECADRHLALYRRTLGGPESEMVPMTSVVKDGESPGSMTPKTQELTPLGGGG